MDSRNRKQSIWRQNISKFDKTTLHVPKKTVWREVSSWKTSFPNSGPGQVDLNHSFSELWQKKLVLIIAFYKHRGTTWWREIFNKQSTNRFWSLRTLRKKLRISGKKLLHWHLCWNFILNARLISFKRKIPRKISFCFSTLERRI